VIGLGLKKITKKPWIADFRDPWTQIDYWEDLKLTKWADRMHRKLEKEVLIHADKVVCVSPQWGEGLARIGNRKIDYISNGFDDEDLHTDIKVDLDKKFTIVHIGMMGKSRNHSIFWQAISELMEEHQTFAQDVEIKLYGKVDESVPIDIKKYNLEKISTIVSYTPHSEIIKIQMQSRVLYLSINQTANAKGILTGKIYEYLAARRPILCIGPVDGEAAKVLTETGAGVVSDFGDITLLKKNILDLYNDYKSGKNFNGGVGYMKYSRKEQTKQLAALLDEVILKSDIKKN
jgi:glycosyltransferase involved in cell wall biosynthesis